MIDGETSPAGGTWLDTSMTLEATLPDDLLAGPIPSVSISAPTPTGLPPDLVEFVRADVTGLDGVHRLVRERPEVPIVVLTGSDDQTRALQAMRAGAQDYLVKDRVDADLLARAIRYAVERMRMDPPPLDHSVPAEQLRLAAGRTVTAEGIGGLAALQVFEEVLAPACISVDHPRFLSFVPAAPTEAAILFDLVVGASSIYAGSWLEGAGAIHAENEALRWIADLVGLPAGAGAEGAFAPRGGA